MEFIDITPDIDKYHIEKKYNIKSGNNELILYPNLPYNENKGCGFKIIILAKNHYHITKKFYQSDFPYIDYDILPFKIAKSFFQWYIDTINDIS